MDPVNHDQGQAIHRAHAMCDKHGLEPQTQDRWRALERMWSARERRERIAMREAIAAFQVTTP